MIRREASVEREVRRSLRRMVMWRILGELIFVPLQYFFSFLHLFFNSIAAVFIAIGGFFTGLRLWCGSMERALFYFEIDAARRYKNLTGLDMGTAASEPRRYGAMDPNVADTIQESYMRSIVESEEQS